MGNVLSDSQPLFDAIAEGDAEGAIKVIESHPGLSHKRAGTKSRTLYHACASNGQVGVLRRICEHVWHNVPDEFGKTHPGSIPEGRFHPTIYQAVNSYDQAGDTPLVLACRKGHPQVVEYLLSQGADPWIGDRLLGRAPLHHAARANQPECIEVILSSVYIDKVGKVRTREHKLVDYPSSSGYTPLHYAAASRAADAAMALCRHGANPNAKNWDMGFDFIQLDRGSTPLHAAARFQNLDMAMTLLTYWYDNLKDQDVTDPRVVDNYHRVKPYQLPGIKANKALLRVLDPSTPIREISDPFGTGSGSDKAAGAAALLHVRSQRQRSGNQDSDPAFIPGGAGEKAPAGWEDVLSSGGGTGAPRPRANGQQFVTVYRCPEFAGDGDEQPVATATATLGVPGTSKGAGKLGRSQSATRSSSSSVVPQVPGMGRARSGAIAPVILSPSHSHPTAATAGPSSPTPQLRDTGGSGAASPSGAPDRSGAQSRTISAESSSSRYGDDPRTTSSRLHPVTPPRADRASASASPAGSSPEKSPGRSLTKTLSKKLSALTGAAVASQPVNPPLSTNSNDSTNSSNISGGNYNGGDANSNNGNNHNNNNFKVYNNNVLGGSGSGSLSDTSSIGAPAGQASARCQGGPSSRVGSPSSSGPGSGSIPAARVTNAWADPVFAGPAKRKGKGPQDPQQQQQQDVCFTRDSHAEDAEPVEVTMYPHIRVNLTRLKQGETGNDLADVTASTSAAAASGGCQNAVLRQASSRRGADEADATVGRRAGGAPAGYEAPQASVFSVSRQGMLPTNDLSEDESVVESVARAKLSPQPSRRRS